MTFLFFVLALVLPPIGQSVSCDDPRYPDLCDSPMGPTGPPMDSNYTLPNQTNIVITLENGTIINLSVFANGTIGEIK